MENIKIHVLHTGQVIIDEALPFHQEHGNPIAWTGFLRSKNHQISCPVSTYLIEHPKGLVLIDTGWHTDNREHQIKNLSFQYPVNKADLPEGQAIHEQLAKLGYQTSDLDYVILSHMHCDHADGLRLVKDAKKIIVSEEEWHAANHDKFHYLPHEWKGVDVKTFHLEKTGLGPQERSFDLFGDGSLVFVWVPGHSEGLCATIIKSPNSEDYVFLTSDAAYASRSWKENLTPGVVIDRKQAQESLDWVKEMAESNHCIEAIANHDPEVKPHTITLSYEL